MVCSFLSTRFLAFYFMYFQSESGYSVNNRIWYFACHFSQMGKDERHRWKDFPFMIEFTCFAVNTLFNFGIILYFGTPIFFAYTYNRANLQMFVSSNYSCNITSTYQIRTRLVYTQCLCRSCAIHEGSEKNLRRKRHCLETLIDIVHEYFYMWFFMNFFCVFLW